jgi:hypothetical protein
LLEQLSKTRSEIVMTREHDFVVDLAKAGKPAKAIKEIADAAHGNKALFAEVNSAHRG